MTILLVDDEVVALNALKRRVDWTRYGAGSVLSAGSMAEAQEIFRSHTVDIMLSDIEMPQGSGLDLFEWVKTYYPDVECVYVTCHSDFSMMRKALQLGSADYLLKPIDYAELDTILTRLVERRNAARDGANTPEEIPEHILRTLKREDRDRTGSDEIVEAVKRFVREHIQENIRISEIAARVYLNEQYLSRVFKKATGMGILEYITEERLRLAKKLLLETDYPVSRVADTVGYNNYSYFIRVFKRDVGKTPQAFRESR